MEKNKMSKPAIFMHSVIIVTCLASIICFTLYYGNIYKNTIEEILTKFNTAVTEDDYNSMANVLNCLYGSCMIPFPYYVESTIEPEETPLSYYNYFRLSEDNNLRATENNNLRLKA